MNVEVEQSTRSGDPSPEQFAEAAAWVAKLHGPDHTWQLENGLRRWLKASPGHAAAFESMTAAWEVTGRLLPAPFARLSRWQRAGYRDGFIRSAVAVAALAIVAVGIFIYLQRISGITTTIGEQRLLTLEDGSRIYMNTATRVRVKYDDRTRRIELKGGEALFDVAKQSERPFIVDAGGRQIRALGTSFVVREDTYRTSVTLVDGKVAVLDLLSNLSLSPSLAPEESGTKGENKPSSGTGRLATGGGKRSRDGIILVPGQRVTFLRTASMSSEPKVDTPSIEKVTAWRHGQVDFESTPLVTAVEEMNRYSATKIVLDGATLAGGGGGNLSNIPITGVFRAGDVQSFAAAVARAYEFQVSKGSGEIILRRMAATTD